MVIPFRSTPWRWGRLMALVLTWPLVGALHPARGATMFSYLSSPYSWVGGGETVSISAEDGFAFTATPLPWGISFAINDIANSPEPRWWELDLATADDQPLTIGSYSGATRYPFNRAPFAEPATPGLSFTGNGRGNSALTGSFDVLEASFADDGSVLSFAADFVQYDEGWSNWWNKGAIRFHSDLPIALTPDPIVDPEPEPIELGQPPDTELPPLEEPPIIGPILIVDPPILVEEPVEGGWPYESSWYCRPANENESLFLFIPGSCPQPIDDPAPIDVGSEIVWYFSSGASSEMAPPMMYDNIQILESSTPISPAATPGPLPAAAAVAGWQSSRRLRRRCGIAPRGLKRNKG